MSTSIMRYRLPFVHITATFFSLKITEEECKKKKWQEKSAQIFQNKAVQLSIMQKRNGKSLKLMTFVEFLLQVIK